MSLTIYCYCCPGTKSSLTLQPHGLQHARSPCPSLSLGVCPSSCPLRQWCHQTISSSVTHFSFCVQSFPASWPFLMSWLFHQVAKVLELQLQLQHQSFQWVLRVYFLKDWPVWSPCSPRDSQESSPTPQFKSINSSVISLFHIQLSHPYMTTRKTIA